MCKFPCFIFPILNWGRWNSNSFSKYSFEMRRNFSVWLSNFRKHTVASQYLRWPINLYLKYCHQAKHSEVYDVHGTVWLDYLCSLCQVCANPIRGENRSYTLFYGALPCPELFIQVAQLGVEYNIYLQLHDAGLALFPTKFCPNDLAALCSQANVVDMRLTIWVFWALSVHGQDLTNSIWCKCHILCQYHHPPSQL